MPCSFLPSWGFCSSARPGDIVRTKVTATVGVRFLSIGAFPSSARRTRSVVTLLFTTKDRTRRIAVHAERPAQQPAHAGGDAELSGWQSLCRWLCPPQGTRHQPPYAAPFLPN